MANGNRLIRSRTVFLKDDMFEFCEYLMKRMGIKIRVDYIEDCDELETRVIKSFYQEYECEKEPL